MNQLVSIKIIHDVVNRHVYNLYAEFFRFVGVYTGEGILDEYKHEELENDLECFQFFLCISGNDNEPKTTAVSALKDAIYIKASAYDFSNGMYLPQGVDMLMTGILAQMEEKAKQYSIEFPVDSIKDLLDVYIEFNILKAAMLLQYYRRKHELHQESEKIFDMAYEKLCQKRTNSACPRFYEYAKLYCKENVNLACYYQEGIKPKYPIADLARECDELIKKYPEFSNAKVLLGLVYRISNDYKKEAIDAFQLAILQEGDKCYSSHIYYWIGLVYEKFLSGHEDAKTAYKTANIRKEKYRNVYKIGKMCRLEGDIEGELHYYKMCSDILERKMGRRMDPLEMEYYFKVEVLICFLYAMKFGRYLEAIDVGEKILAFYLKTWGDKTDNALFLEYGCNQYAEMCRINNPVPDDYDYFFGQEADSIKEGKYAGYRAISKSLLRLKKVFESLAIAYRETGDSKKAELFWRLASVSQ